MADVFYCFKAVDEDVGIDLDCLVTLSYSPAKRPHVPIGVSGSLAATFVLGQFKADDIAQQAYSWFIGQHNVSIDQDGLESFLTSIQSYTITQYIDVRIDIVSPESRVLMEL